MEFETLAVVVRALVSALLWAGCVAAALLLLASVMALAARLRRSSLQFGLPILGALALIVPPLLLVRAGKVSLWAQRQCAAFVMPGVPDGYH